MMAKAWWLTEKKTSNLSQGLTRIQTGIMSLQKIMSIALIPD